MPWGRTAAPERSTPRCRRCGAGRWPRSPARAETTLNQEPGNPQSLENQVRHSCEHCGDNEQAGAGLEDSPQPTAGQVKEPRNSSSTWLNASGCSIGGECAVAASTLLPPLTTAERTHPAL